MNIILKICNVHDHSIEKHSSRVSMIAGIIARNMEKTDHSIDANLIEKAAAYHDIGKVGIPGAVLNKPGRLTDFEYNMIKKHPNIGAHFIEKIPDYENVPVLRTAYQICKYHHERYDGKGYPEQLKGNEIPLAAQIASVADVYDALTAKRCYKDSLSHQKAVDMILHGECGSFNPRIVNCFLQCESEIRACVA